MTRELCSKEWVVDKVRMVNQIKPKYCKWTPESTGMIDRDTYNRTVIGPYDQNPYSRCPAAAAPWLARCSTCCLNESFKLNMRPTHLMCGWGSYVLVSSGIFVVGRITSGISRIFLLYGCVKHMQSTLFMSIFSPFHTAHVVTLLNASCNFSVLAVGSFNAVYSDPSSTNSPAVIGISLCPLVLFGFCVGSFWFCLSSCLNISSSGML